jgi:hypothetical protein
VRDNATLAIAKIEKTTKQYRVNTVIKAWLGLSEVLIQSTIGRETVKCNALRDFSCAIERVVADGTRSENFLRIVSIPDYIPPVVSNRASLNPALRMRAMRLAVSAFSSNGPSRSLCTIRVPLVVNSMDVGAISVNIAASLSAVARSANVPAST